jgi:hypothetical protein
MSKNDLSPPTIPIWQMFERRFISQKDYPEPFQNLTLAVTFIAPGGQEFIVNGFWDGGNHWKVRFSPNQLGAWRYATHCSNPEDDGLHAIGGTFNCIDPQGSTPFERHGPVQLSHNRRHLVHADGTPYFYLADTVWNGAMQSTPADWLTYLNTRARQGFSAVQFVTTQWRGAPDGDRDGRLAYSGHSHIHIDPHFFQNIDEKIRAINAAGLLAAPVLLWAIELGSPDGRCVNPGACLPVDQAARLAAYMRARWSAFNVLWILGGDGQYSGHNAGRWQAIGRSVFGEGLHAPVALHGGGLHDYAAAFSDEPWLDVIGYQSGHGIGRRSLNWLLNGPPAAGWQNPPARPWINLEPCYEGIPAYRTRIPINAHAVRRSLYWSLLIAPAAGVAYGREGVWGWNDGCTPTPGHENEGIPPGWQAALHSPAASHILHLWQFFETLPWPDLHPESELLAVRPGKLFPEHTIRAASTQDRSTAVVYLPDNRGVSLRPVLSRAWLRAKWYNPRSGAFHPAIPIHGTRRTTFQAPDQNDWLLLLEK